MLSARLNKKGSVVDTGRFKCGTSMETTQLHDQQISLYSHAQKTFVKCARSGRATKNRLLGVQVVEAI